MQKFQFTPLREGRLCGLGVTGTARLFQFTPLREGRRGLHGVLFMPMYFNSRPSARGDGEDRKKLMNRISISIHAPPRGATILLFRQNDALCISIHAPPRGATLEVAQNGGCCDFDFNSRPSARGDLSGYIQPSAFLFQFTPLREGRRLVRYFDRVRIAFQFTPLREGRRIAESEPRRLAISIHAPPRGATGVISPLSSCVLFQFTPLREGRRGVISPLSSCVLFQFTPLREGRRLCTMRKRRLCYFNSRPSARGDPRRRNTRFAVLPISIHAPPRGATS